MSRLIEIDLSVALGRFSLSVRWESDERSLGVFGPSGAGKTTLLAALAGLQSAASGRLVVGGKVWLDSARGIRLAPETRGVGYVPQEGLLMPHRDVKGNLLVGEARARRASGRQPSFDRVVSILELEPLLARGVGGLSGGERQRVALGRALLSGPELLLLDEPLAGLDLPLRRRILPYLVRVGDEFGLPTLLVSHDPGEVQVLCREILVLEAGRVMAQGPPGRLFTMPAVFALARAEGFENLLRGRIVSADRATSAALLEGGESLMVTGAPASHRGEVIVGVRSEDLILALEKPHGLSAQNLLPGTIARIEREPGEGGQVMVMVEVGAPPSRFVVAITAQAVAQLSLAPGLPVFLIAKAQACRVVALL